MMDSLKKICLENNNIQDRGAQALSKVLEENDTLLSLYLENNGITHVGA
jgi:Ran GTPase-activating protein (RanGAP) involved in mRNA processing and transport